MNTPDSPYSTPDPSAKPGFRELARQVLVAPVIVGALGYFVDIYDLVLFSIVRVSSLRSLGLEGDALLSEGVTLINLQMFGMLVGGLLWGVLGDKKGRITVLFGSIFLYSTANILNAFVTNTTQYGVLRFIAGVGLAGELGAAITLVSEVLPKNLRGYGTTIVAAVGLLGAVLAGIVGERFSWQTAYIVGGVLGFVLLVTRIRLHDSGMFSQTVAKHGVSRGKVSMLFTDATRFWKYIRCIGLGVPIWFVVGILITFSPEITRELGVQGAVTGGKAILYCYVGMAFGDVTAGLVSQWLGSRKKAIWIFLFLTIGSCFAYSFIGGRSSDFFYFICVLLGIGSGYWALFVTVASEQFGTNLRATVTTSVPNFVRGSVIPMTVAFESLRLTQGLMGSALFVGVTALSIAMVSLFFMDESFHKDLDYLEIHS